MLQVNFCVLNAVTAQQLAVAAKYNAEPDKTETGSTVFSFNTEKFSLADANEIAEAFGRVTIWGPYKQTSTLRFGYGWECMLDDCGWTMIPGFDNSPQYNVESVELCLL